MKFIFREFSEEMPASRLTTSEPEEHCSRSWFISSNTEVGVHLWKWASMGRVSPRKIGSSSSCKRRYIYQSREDIKQPEVRICYERAERLCHSVNRPLLLSAAMIGQWRYSLVTEKLSVTMQIAKRVYSLAQEQNSSALLLKACMALAATLYYLGDFEASRQYAIGGVQLWRSGGVQSQLEEVDPPIIACLCHEALIEWHFGEIASCKATMAPQKSRSLFHSRSARKQATQNIAAKKPRPQAETSTFLFANSFSSLHWFE
jgi:hypothetical protein